MTRASPQSPQPPSAWSPSSKVVLLLAVNTALLAVLVVVLIAGFAWLGLRPAVVVHQQPTVAAADEPRGVPYLVPAGRSPIPQPGEAFTEPIAPRQLADPSTQRAPQQTASAGQVVPWSQAPQYMGQTITIEGQVIETRNIGNLCFLNFTRDRDQFYVVIYKEAFDSFPAAPEVHFSNRTVQVTGEVTTFRDRGPQIQVRSAEQIRIVK